MDRQPVSVISANDDTITKMQIFPLEQSRAAPSAAESGKKRLVQTRGIGRIHKSRIFPSMTMNHTEPYMSLWGNIKRFHFYKRFTCCQSCTEPFVSSTLTTTRCLTLPNNQSVYALIFHAIYYPTISLCHSLFTTIVSAILTTWPYYSHTPLLPHPDFFTPHKFYTNPFLTRSILLKPQTCLKKSFLTGLSYSYNVSLITIK